MCEEWLAFKMFLVFWLRPAKHLVNASVYPAPPQLWQPQYLAADFVYLYKNTSHVAECDASVRVGWFTWLRLAWRASRMWR